MEEVEGILAGALDAHPLSGEDALTLMDPALTPLPPLLEAADSITREKFGREVELCAIYPAKSGRCGGDCAFCAQSIHHDCQVTPRDLAGVDGGELVAYAEKLLGQGVSRFSLVTSGERLTDAEFDRILALYGQLRETGIGLCASLGSLDPRRAARLLEAGVTRYHHNLETAESHFPSICSTHSYRDKLETIRIAREAGLEVCSGGILFLGETPQQRVEMALSLRELDVDCIPINLLNPIPGTRLEKQPRPDVDDVLRTIAVFRLLMRDKPLLFAGGREEAMGGDEYRGFRAGINAMIVDGYLTTPGKRRDQELASLKKAGVTPVKHR